MQVGDKFYHANCQVVSEWTVVEAGGSSLAKHLGYPDFVLQDADGDYQQDFDPSQHFATPLPSPSHH